MPSGVGMLGVSRSGFYASQKRGPSGRAAEDEKLAVAVVAAHKVGRGAYGSPRVHEELKADGVAVSRKRGRSVATAAEP